MEKTTEPTTEKVDPIDAALEQVEAEKAASKLAEGLSTTLERLDSHILMLRGLGVQASVILNTEVDERQDRAEMGPADNRWTFYCDLDDVEGCKAKIRRVRELQEYARNQGVVPLPRGAQDPKPVKREG